jgi:hypothetical protein
MIGKVIPERKCYEMPLMAESVKMKAIGILGGNSLLINDRKSYTGAQVLRWVHEEKLTG